MGQRSGRQGLGRPLLFSREFFSHDLFQPASAQACLRKIFWRRQPPRRRWRTTMEESCFARLGTLPLLNQMLRMPIPRPGCPLTISLTKADKITNGQSPRVGTAGAVARSQGLLEFAASPPSRAQSPSGRETKRALKAAFARVSAAGDSHPQEGRVSGALRRVAADPNLHRASGMCCFRNAPLVAAIFIVKAWRNC